jgi:FkbM family methyltransferase
MDKIQLLKKLDQVVQFADKLFDFQSLINNSNRVDIIISSEGVKVYQKETGASFYWNVGDPRTAIACLAITGEYELKETILVSAITKHCKYVVDVGANVGYYAVNIPLMSPSVEKVYAFEPIPDAYEQLSKNVQCNGIESRVKLFNLAVSEIEQDLELFVPKVFGSSATSSVALHPEVSNTKIVVKSRTLDQLTFLGAIEGCDFLKIDVEGAEKFVLEGASRMLSQQQPIILAEILRKWSRAQGYHANDVVLLLKALGYTCYAIGNDLTRVDEIAEDLVETNFLFLTSSNPLHRVVALELGLIF